MHFYLGWKGKSAYLFSSYLLHALLAVLGLRCCMQAFSDCDEQGVLSGCIAVTSHCCGFSIAEHRRGVQASVVVATQAQVPPAYEIFLDQGLNPCPQLWQVYSWPLHHQGNPTYFFKADRHQKHHKIPSMMELQFLWFGYKWLCIYTSRLVSFQLSKVCKWGLGLTEDVHCYDLISGLKAQYFHFCFFFIQVAWTHYRPQDLPAKYNHDLESWFHSS